MTIKYSDRKIPTAKVYRIEDLAKSPEAMPDSMKLVTIDTMGVKTPGFILQ